MKTLNNYITESLHITKKTKTYKYCPETTNELIEILKEKLAENKNANLNDIDVTQITEMNLLFYDLDPHNIDISNWDVSNVTDMSDMFFDCKNLNCDLSKWDVSNVTTMNGIFSECENFNSDLSNWDVSNVKDMCSMFYKCKKFNSDLSKWNVSNVKHMDYMFDKCTNLKLDISNWNTSNLKSFKHMFLGCDENSIVLGDFNKDPDKPKTRGSKELLWWQVWQILDKNGPMSKEDILNKLKLVPTGYTTLFAKWKKLHIIKSDKKKLVACPQNEWLKTEFF